MYPFEAIREPRRLDEKSLFSVIHLSSSEETLCLDSPAYLPYPERKSCTYQRSEWKNRKAFRLPAKGYGNKPTAKDTAPCGVI